jgi:hypothetical protein
MSAPERRSIRYGLSQSIMDAPDVKVSLLTRRAKKRGCGGGCGATKRCSKIPKLVYLGSSLNGDRDGGLSGHFLLSMPLPRVVTLCFLKLHLFNLLQLPRAVVARILKDAVSVCLVVCVSFPTLCASPTAIRLAPGQHQHFKRCKAGVWNGGTHLRELPHRHVSRVVSCWCFHGFVCAGNS